MKRLLLVPFLIVNFSLWAGEFHPFDGPKPIVVVIQTDPWSMVIGSDVPRLAAYEDGTIIFLKKSETNVNYYSKKLSESELQDLRKHLKPVADFKNLKLFYNLLPNVTDQPEARLFLQDGNRSLATRVYGLRMPEGHFNPHTLLSKPKGNKPDDVPNELLELHKYLCSLDYADSKEWSPKYVEVMIWPYEYAPDASIQWPKSWPGLGSERSFKRDESYSIFLDGNLLPELQRFLKTRNEKGAVEIAGKKWAVSYRPVFPSEPVWMTAFAKSEGK